MELNLTLGVLTAMMVTMLMEMTEVLVEEKKVDGHVLVVQLLLKMYELKYEVMERGLILWVLIEMILI